MAFVHSFSRLLAVGFCLLLSVSPLNAAKVNENKVGIILADSPLSETCKQAVMAFSGKLIGPKKHRVLSNHSAPPIFEAFILIHYNDQDSHALLSAVDTEQGCRINYTENFDINMPCMGAREALFKRWKLLGKLSEITLVVRYDYPRDKKTLPASEAERTRAYLTQTRRGASCLVTKRQLITIP